MSNLPSPTSLAFLIMPDFPMACLTSAIEPLRVANEITGRNVFSWQVVGEIDGSICSSAGVRFDPDIPLAQITSCKALYILGNPDGKFSDTAKAHATLRRLARTGTKIGAFSGGIFTLARTGLLEGKKCSVHWVYEAAFKHEFPKVTATDRVMTIDKNIETASGAAAVFDLMLHHIEQELGAEIMTEAACWFQHPNVRGESVAQRLPARQIDRTQDMFPPVVAAAIKIFDNHLSEPVSIKAVAHQLDISSRQLDRNFLKATGQTPLRYFRAMRLEKARQLVLYSNASITNIATSVGYSRKSFLNYYTQAFGALPQEQREQTNHFRVEDNLPLPQM